MKKLYVVVAISKNSEKPKLVMAFNSIYAAREYVRQQEKSPTYSEYSELYYAEVDYKQSEILFDDIQVKCHRGRGYNFHTYSDD